MFYILDCCATSMMSFSKYLVSGLLLLAFTVALCSAADQGDCAALTGTVDLTATEPANIYFTGCTIDSEVVLENIPDNSYISIIQSTFSTGGKITIASVGKAVTLRFYDIVASAAFIDTSAATLTMEDGNIFFAGVTGTGSVTLVPTTISLTKVNGVPSIQSSNTPAGALGGTVAAGGMTYFTGSTLTAAVPSVNVFTVYTKATITALDPAVVVAETLVILGEDAILTTCANTGAGLIFLLPGSSVGTLDGDVCTSAVSPDAVLGDVETIPDDEAQAALLDYTGNGAVLCGTGTAAADGCTCSYGTGTQAFCAPAQPNSFSAPSGCTDSLYDLCLDEGDDGTGGNDNGSGSGSTSFGGKSSFAAASSIVALVAAAALAL